MMANDGVDDNKRVVVIESSDEEEVKESCSTAQDDDVQQFDNTHTQQHDICNKDGNGKQKSRKKVKKKAQGKGKKVNKAKGTTNRGKETKGKEGKETHTLFEKDNDQLDSRPPPHNHSVPVAVVIDSTETESTKDQDDGLFVLDTFASEAQLTLSVHSDDLPDRSHTTNNPLSGVLTPEQPTTTTKEERPKRRLIECFNCNGPHAITKCPEPKNFARISRNRAAQRVNSTADAGRYHGGPGGGGQSDDLARRFRAGCLSSDLTTALGMRSNELPEWIYRMRQMGFIDGYPPGHLKQAILQDQSALTRAPLVFHMDQPDDTDNPVQQDRSPSPPLAPPTLDSRRIIYYFGFNKEARSNTRDRDGRQFVVPQFEHFVSMHEEELARKHQEQVQQTTSAKRRNTQRPQEARPVKKQRVHSPDDVDMELCDEEPAALLPPAPLPPSDYDALSEHDLEALLTKKQAEFDALATSRQTDDQQTGVEEGGMETPKRAGRRLVRIASSRSVHVECGTALCPTGETTPLHKPSLENFSQGIVPFEMREETSVTQKGFFKRFIKQVLHRNKQPVIDQDRTTEGEEMGERRQKRKKKIRKN